MSASKKFKLHSACEDASQEVFDFLLETVKRARISLDQGGGDRTILAAGIKAGEKILAYGHGMPSQRHELTGKDGEPIKSEIDMTKLSTQALKEILAARTAKKE